MPGAGFERLRLAQEDHGLVRTGVVMVVLLDAQGGRRDEDAGDVFLGVIDAQGDGLGAIEAELEGGDEVLELHVHAARGAMHVGREFFDADAVGGSLPLAFGDLPLGGGRFLGEGVGDELLVRLREQGGRGFGGGERRDEGEQGEEAERHGRRGCEDVTAETDEGCDYS